MSDSTAVTTTTGEGGKVDRYVGLPAAMRAELEARRAANIMAAEVAKLSWGATLDVRTARSIAEWGQRHHVDVTQEIDLLGGRVYLNGKFYIRRIGELIREGKVASMTFEHVNHDPRLEELAKAGDEWAREEHARRLRLRIKHNIPDKATGACICRIQHVHMTEPVEGVEFCGGGTSTSKDPVGDAEPMKTAETRAARRAGRLLASHVPELRDIERVEASVGVIEAEIEHDRQVNAPRRVVTPALAAGEYDEPPAPPPPPTRTADDEALDLLAAQEEAA